MCADEAGGYYGGYLQVHSASLIIERQRSEILWAVSM